ncbi:GAF domain-containing protein [Mucilaginibacter robiniae]|uniref:histidine kinase n=1 Tax=Mucilaginibacter robiniae TaxID=2728022 RepID=A0A7L5E662_9SPHI|nr:GAF domain-containing protein [Mucilaginibacter robiniae]QJD97254.1 GAF domain-containing protein [Mucilaginibacter robiniae]
MLQQEIERQEAVNRLLKLQISKEQELQSIVKLAAEICGTPTALITLIDENTQYIRFKQAFDFDTTPRQDAFCNHVIKHDAVMVVPDAYQDERFQNNPLVTGNPNIRFYAGAPLSTKDGYNLGSLCVIDQVPRDLTIDQQQMLKILSKQAIQVLEFEASIQVLKDQFEQAKSMEMKMRAFFESSASSHLLLDKEYRVLTFNKALKDFIKKAYDVELEVGISVHQFVEEAYIADFIGFCNVALAGRTIRHEHLLKIAERAIWCRITYEPARNSDGEIVGVSYNARDITERVENEQASQAHKASLNRIAFIQSHELRRPVATIKGLLDLLEMDGHVDQIAELSLMKKSVNDIDRKINQIVNYTTALV